MNKNDMNSKLKITLGFILIVSVCFGIYNIYSMLKTSINGGGIIFTLFIIYFSYKIFKFMKNLNNKEEIDLSKIQVLNEPINAKKAFMKNIQKRIISTILVWYLLIIIIPIGSKGYYNNILAFLLIGSIPMIFYIIYNLIVINKYKKNIKSINEKIVDLNKNEYTFRCCKSNHDRYYEQYDVLDESNNVIYTALSSYKGYKKYIVMDYKNNCLGLIEQQENILPKYLVRIVKELPFLITNVNNLEYEIEGLDYKITYNSDEFTISENNIKIARITKENGTYTLNLNKDCNNKNMLIFIVLVICIAETTLLLNKGEY